VISLGALVALISFDVTASMIAAGQVSKSWSIASVTNTTPIHVTTTSPHGVAPGVKMHAVIAGVSGTTNANGVWELAFVDASTFSLGTYSPVGAPVASVGNAAYTSGGTISTVLDQGRILLGRKFLTSHGTPPRVVFVPSAAPLFDFVALGGQTLPLSTLPPTISQMTPEQISMTEQPPILTDHSRWEVYVWGAATPADPDFADFDVTRALRDQVIASGIRLMSQPFFKVLGGVWESQLEGERGAAWDSLGQVYKMLVEIVQPIVDDPFSFVPSGIHATLTVQPANPGPSDPIVIVTAPVP
jgi:hypothetical protein